MVRKKKDIEFMMTVLKALIISMSGWAVFNGTSRWLGFDTLEPGVLIIGGLIAAWITFRIGIRKI